MAGFIVSIAGIFLCGIPSVIGLPLSLMGLRKDPKGFAIAGTIISLVGLIELVLFCMLMYMTYQVAQTASTAFSKIIVAVELKQDANQVAEQWERTGQIPDQAEGQAILDRSPSFNSNKKIYETDGTSFTLRDVGEDGEPNTPDDVTIGPFNSFEEAKRYEPEMEDFGDFEGEFDFDQEFNFESDSDQ